MLNTTYYQNTKEIYMYVRFVIHTLILSMSGEIWAKVWKGIKNTGNVLQIYDVVSGIQCNSQYYDIYWFDFCNVCISVLVTYFQKPLFAEFLNNVSVAVLAQSSVFKILRPIR